MNYYQARELRTADGKPAGLWHFTCQNDNRIWPVGYCAQGCVGHDTPEGAQEHYRQYLLDTARYDGRMSGQQRACRVCGAWTQRFAETEAGTSLYVLCDEHCNRESLETLVKAPEWITSSW
jgi:hypothetical protein